ncbi:MAG: metallophosphoesterase [Alphaproteobacteria bacterium]|nr:metallophosphoesterase [Alphaproteobacteria bacterium]
MVFKFFFKTIVFILIQAIVVLNCAFALQNPSDIHTQRDVHDLLSPRTSITRETFLGFFDALQQKISRGEEAEGFRLTATPAKDFRGEEVLLGGNTREFKLLLAALLHQVGSQNIVSQIFQSTRPVMQNEELLNTIFTSTRITDESDLLLFVNDYADDEETIDVLPDIVAIAQQYGKDYSQTAAQHVARITAAKKSTELNRQLDKQYALQLLQNFNKAIQNGKYQRGAIVDLRALPSDKEVILVGDLHTRLDNLKKTLNEDGNLSKVQRGDAVLVILGDAVHSETNLEEMDSSVEIMRFIMKLKNQNPDNVYYVLGNHDYLSSTFLKNGVFQGIIYRNKLENLYGEEYVSLYERFIKNSPLMVIGNGFIGIHGGPIRNTTLEDIQNVDVADESHPIVNQAQRGRYSQGDYAARDVQNFLNDIGQPQAQLIVGHSPQRDGNWHWQVLDNHHIIFAGYDRAGYAVLDGEGIQFVEVSGASPKLALDEQQVDIKSTSFEQKTDREYLSRAALLINEAI